MTSGEMQYDSPYLSIAIFAWNEERILPATLHSLLEQSLFKELETRGLRCEIICVANGCTDQTAAVAAKTLQTIQNQHPDRQSWTGKAVDLRERGKLNAWNQFVHNLSANSARYLFMMDADILIHRPETMWNMLATLETDSQATVAVDVPRKDIGFKSKKTFGERLSMAASRMTLAADGQLCGQLYCIRAEAARRIYLPKDLAACEDGLIKILVCTDFLEHPAWPQRIRVAPNAEHTFEAYSTPSSILKNQKRQIIGQTMIHVLVDKYLRNIPVPQRHDLRQFLQRKDTSEPAWLKTLLAAHLKQVRFCWRLYPGLAGNRLARLGKLTAAERVRCLPAALAGSCSALLASLLAYRSLKGGCTDYWPKANRAGLKPMTERAQPGDVGATVNLSRAGGLE